MPQLPPLVQLWEPVLFTCTALGAFSFGHRLIFIYAENLPQHPDLGTPWCLRCPSVIYTKPALNSVTLTLFPFSQLESSP